MIKPWMLIPPVASGDYSAETLAYQTRVEADGGTVIDLDAVEAAYSLMAAQSISPVFWYSPLFGSKTAVVGENTLVQTLYDISSNNYDLSQATENARPIFASEVLNGHPALNFPTTQSRKITASVALTSNAYSFFVVSRKHASGSASEAYSRVLSLSPSTGYDYNNTSSMLIGYDRTGPIVQFYRNSASVTQETITYNVFNLTSVIWNGANVSQFINGGTEDTGTTSSASLNTQVLRMGTDSANVDSFLNGDIAEVICISGAVSSGQRSAIESYLNGIWSVY